MVDIADAMTDGLEKTIAHMGGSAPKTFIQGAGMMFNDTKAVIGPVIAADGGVLLAVPGMIVSSVRVQALLVITPATVIAAGRKGLFGKKVESISVERSRITGVTVGTGNTASLAKARLLKINTSSGPFDFALPLDQPSLEAALVQELSPAR